MPGKHGNFMPEVFPDDAPTIPLPEWAKELGFSSGFAPLSILASRLTAAFVLGCVVAFVYWLSSGRRIARGDRSLPATLVLLSVVIALVTQVIGDSTARAFSLVGALAIVRFRTVVEDTRDTAFVIFAVATGMAAGVGYILWPLVCMPFVLLTGLLFRPRSTAATLDSLLVVRVGIGHTASVDVQPALAKRAKSSRLVGMATARGGSAVDITYEVRLASGDQAGAMVNEISRIEGVHGVELRERT